METLFLLTLFGGLSLVCRWLLGRLNYIGRFAISVPGVIVHELGHLMFAIIFGHKIHNITWVKLRSGLAQGEVAHSYRVSSFRQRLGSLIIPLGPLFSSALVLMVLWPLYGLPLTSTQIFAVSLATNLTQIDLEAMALLLLVASISSCCWPSFADWQNFVRAALRHPLLATLVCLAVWYCFRLVEATLVMLVASAGMALVVLLVLWIFCVLFTVILR